MELEEAGLGSAADIGLADARAQADEWRRQVALGQSPKLERKAAIVAARDAACAAEEDARRKEMTIARAARNLYATLLPGWRNLKHAETWIASIELHVNPHFGDKPVSEVTREDVKGALQDMWLDKHETEKQVRQRISAIFEWASAEGYCAPIDPTVGIQLPKVKAIPRHLAAMPWRDVPAFMQQLSAQDGTSARCLEFIILTGARSNEARGLRWSEVDGEGAIWVVPAERMKRGLEHRVPLAPVALPVLDRVSGLDSDLVFPSHNVRPAAKESPCPI